MTLASTFCFLLAAVFLLVLLRDLFPRWARKFHSRRSASWADESSFFKKINLVARKWLLHPPMLPVCDTTRWLLWDDIHQRKLRAEVRRGWPLGLLAKGIMVSDSYGGGGRDVLEKFYGNYLTEEGGFRFPLKYVDDALHGEILVYLFKKSGELKYRQAIDELFAWLLERSRQAHGTLPYRETSPVRFVDTLGMIVPFLLEYGIQFANPTARELAVLHLEEFVLHAVEKNSGLPFHGYNAEFSNTPTGLFSWGRGAGWYVIGLVEALIRLTPKHEKYGLFEDSFRKLAATVRALQKIDGGWGDIINVSTSRYDSSATAIIIYEFKKAMAAGILDPSYQDMLSRGLQRLQKSTTADGVVRDSQGVCMGLDNYSGLFSSTPYSQGMALAAAAIMVLATDQKRI